MLLYLHSVSYLHVGPKAAGGTGLTTVTRCGGTEEMVARQREVVALIIWTHHFFKKKTSQKCFFSFYTSKQYKCKDCMAPGIPSVLIHLPYVQSKAFFGSPWGFRNQSTPFLVVTKPGRDFSKLPLEGCEDEEEMQEVTKVGLEISLRVAAAVVWSEFPPFFFPFYYQMKSKQWNDTLGLLYYLCICFLHTWLPIEWPA